MANTHDEDTSIEESKGPDWRIPLTGLGEPFGLTLSPGEILLVVGPNGAGKSALSYWLAANPPARPITRIYAQRQVWLASAAPDITSSSREMYADIFHRQDGKPESRVKFDAAKERSASLLFDLAARVNLRNARVARVLDTGGNAEEALATSEPSLLKQITSLMNSAGFLQEFAVGEGNTFEAILDGTSYPISEMSDGEKAAFLLAAEVLLVPEGSILLIDEPERHLHRAISSSFIRELTQVRPDCSFVLFTHDDNLMTAGLRTLLISSTSWKNREPSSWILEELSSTGEREDRARLAILGGRGRVLLTEGEVASLDKALYEILYPDWAIQPVGGNDQVIRAVSGMRDSRKHHWVDAAGIIDGDCRTDQERDSLLNKGVLVLPVNEVENIYYLPLIVEYQANRQAEALGRNKEELKQQAISTALGKLSSAPVQANLARKNAIKILRRRALEELPSDKKSFQEHEIIIRLISPQTEELNALERYVKNADHEQIVKRYSIRESAYGKQLATSLGYSDQRTYREAVHASLRRDSKLRRNLLEFLGEPKGLWA